MPRGLAGEEGFEPPHPVLETGGLPLNLLPFTPSHRRGVCPEPQVQVFPRHVAAGEQFPAASLHFFVQCMTPTSGAELLELQPLGRLLLIFGRVIISVLTLATLQCDDFAHLG